MSVKRWALSAAWIVALLSSAFAFQQDQASLQRYYFPKPGDYSVRLPDAKGMRSYIDVPANVPVVTYTFPVLERIKDWQRQPDQPGDPSAIQLKCRREGDAVKIDLTLVVDRAALPGLSGSVVTISALPVDGYLGKTIGSYTVLLGELVTFKELARFGIEPFTVKIVSSNARAGDPSEIKNMTRSIEVLSVDKSRGKYLLSMLSRLP